MSGRSGSASFPRFSSGSYTNRSRNNNNNSHNNHNPFVNSYRQRRPTNSRNNNNNRNYASGSNKKLELLLEEAETRYASPASRRKWLVTKLKTLKNHRSFNKNLLFVLAGASLGVSAVAMAKFLSVPLSPGVLAHISQTFGAYKVKPGLLLKAVQLALSLVTTTGSGILRLLSPVGRLLLLDIRKNPQQTTTAAAAAK